MNQRRYKTSSSRATRAQAAALLVALGGALLTLASRVDACSIVTIRAEMPRSFAVVATESEKLVPGVSVVVIRQGSDGTDHVEVRRGYADARGEFEVKDLPIGDYGIFVGHETAFGGTAHITVTEKSPWRLPRVLRVNWVEGRVLRLKRFVGRLIFEMSAPHIPIEDADVIVRNAKTRELVRTFKTAKDGSFDGGEIPPGLYAVQVRAPKYWLPGPEIAPGQGEVPRDSRDSRVWPLEISRDSDAVASPVEIGISISTCGMHKRVTVMGAGQ